ncbi:zeta toxin family protein [Oscillospiraceae bacterium 50-16]
MKKPEIIVFAGPNGSGKSTLTEILRPQGVPYINADDIQRVLGCDNLEAAKLAEARREAYLESRQSFCFETVLSTDRNLKLLQRAKEAGFFIRCYYVLTADPQINIIRVSDRVLAGGHDVPEDKIRSRYYRALGLIPELIPVCDGCHIYDNSNSVYRIFKKRKEQYWYSPLEGFWLKEDIISLTGIKHIKRAPLNK